MTANLSHMTWAEYVRQTIGGDQQVEAARKAHLDQTTISRWVRGGQAGKAENVVKLARAYGTSVLEALVVAGFISSDEARARVTINRYEDPSDERLLELLANRLRRDREEVVGRAEQPAPTSAGDAALGRLLGFVDLSKSPATHDVSEVDYTLAARDRDDDAESEAQQIDP